MFDTLTLYHSFNPICDFSGPPVITSVEGYIDGSARVLMCHAKGTPYPEIRYYWGDLAINPLFPPRGHSINPDGPSLRIQTDIVDSVAYKCRATNPFGTDVREFTGSNLATDRKCTLYSPLSLCVYVHVYMVTGIQTHL